jgi:molecular chaperone GrpE
VKDLQRLQAEFVNYKNRVERDRDLARTNAIAEVLRSLLPALDDLARAEAHGDLEGSPFAAVATKLRAAGEKFGLSSFGAKGDKFDPELHQALIQTPSADVTENTVADVVEPGYLLGERLVRAAKVAVFIPAE